MGNFYVSIFLRLKWEFLDLESERGDSICWPNNKIIDWQSLFLSLIEAMSNYTTWWTHMSVRRCADPFIITQWDMIVLGEGVDCTWCPDIIIKQDRVYGVCDHTGEDVSGQTEWVQGMFINPEQWGHWIGNSGQRTRHCWRDAHIVLCCTEGQEADIGRSARGWHL